MGDFPLMTDSGTFVKNSCSPKTSIISSSLLKPRARKRIVPGILRVLSIRTFNTSFASFSNESNLEKSATKSKSRITRKNYSRVSGALELFFLNDNH